MQPPTHVRMLYLDRNLVLGFLMVDRQGMFLLGNAYRISSNVTDIVLAEMIRTERFTLACDTFLLFGIYFWPGG